jgi:hypothetical protein
MNYYYSPTARGRGRKEEDAGEIIYLAEAAAEVRRAGYAATSRSKI